LEGQFQVNNNIAELLQTSEDTLLEVSDLSVRIKNSNPQIYIIKNLNLSIKKGQSVSIIGSSGSGKTITARAIIGLLPDSMEMLTGRIFFDGKEMDSQAYAKLRGTGISMIFQEPLSALNPVFTVGTQMKDIIKTNLLLSSKLAKNRSLELLAEMNFENPQAVYHMYPSQLSGGMAQRIMIAMALSCNPQMIIADEPTSALDISTQARILYLIHELQSLHKFAFLMISHDVSLVSHLSDYIYLIENGKITNEGTALKADDFYPSLKIEFPLEKGPSGLSGWRCQTGGRSRTGD
jgi:ABC-type dipeptide/oligopeptide/nickel transport system ATPase component